MRLKVLDLEALNDFEDCEISDIAFRVEDVKKGSLFFCLRGVNFDGHDFAEEAFKRGAAACVCEKNVKEGISVLVKNSRRQLALSCSAFYSHPCRKLKLIAVTGTNGKTTTTYIIKSILESAGHKVGLIGTNCVMIGDEKQAAKLTTPDPTDLHKIFADMADRKVEYVVMEASAHALYLHKLDGIVFKVAAFTNLSQDHLDFFGSMEKYGDAKKRLFASSMTEKSVVNVDDEFGRQLALECDNKLITYGCGNPSDVFAIDLTMSAGGLEYYLNSFDDVAGVKFNLPGRFNMYNTLCAAAVCAALDIPVKNVVKGIRKVTKIDGRFNIIGTSRGSVIIDFAHTPDGLKNILSSIREFSSGRIITVFGCGGDRDAAKRPLMGAVVGSLSDLCVVTSDNPRSENPDKIIDDVVKGIVGKNYICITDRRQAVRQALRESKAGDIVLIAGKGAEKYQEINGVKHEYNDERFVMQLLEEDSL